MLKLTTEISIYTLPLDHQEARNSFLALLHAPGETWIADYGLTDEGLIQEVQAADQRGVPVHLLIDALQERGHQERPLIEELANMLQHGEIIRSTAGPDSDRPREIMHDKVMITRANDGGEDWCWIGSVNFSGSGWSQANIGILFRSNAWSRDVFIPWFKRTSAWARYHVGQVL